jgi:hypothetical protein
MALDLTGIVDKLIGFLPADLQAKAKTSRKAIVAGIGSLLTVLTLVSDRFGFLVPAQYKKPIGFVISILTTALTYLTPNDPLPAGASVADISGA